VNSAVHFKLAMSNNAHSNQELK